MKIFEKCKNDFMAGWEDAKIPWEGEKHYQIIWLGILDTEAVQLDSPRRATVTNSINGIPTKVPEIVAEVMKTHSEFAAVLVQPSDGKKDFGCLVWEEESKATEAVKSLILKAEDLPFTYLGNCGYRQFEVQLCVARGREITKQFESNGKIILSQRFDYPKNDDIVLSNNSDNNILH